MWSNIFPFQLSFVVLLCALGVQTGTFHSLLGYLNSDPAPPPLPTHPMEGKEAMLGKQHRYAVQCSLWKLSYADPMLFSLFSSLI